MLGWLVVNGFLKSENFDGVYSFLLSAAEKYDVKLEIKYSSEMVFPVGEKFISLPDFVLFWDKDVYLASRLENFGIPVFNSAESIKNTDNKILTSLCLAESGIPIPKTIVSPKTFEKTGYNNMTFLDSAADIIGFPMVIKEAFGSFGKQVYLANNISEAQKIIKSLGYKDFLMQEFIEESRGRDIRINVVGNKIITAMERYNPNDFRSNIASGGTAENIIPTDYQKELAIKSCIALGLDFAGVDILFSDENEALVCEVNSNPHFKGAFDLTGINLGDNIIEYIIKNLK